MYPGNQTAICISQDFIVGYLVPILVNSGLPPTQHFIACPSLLCFILNEQQHTGSPRLQPTTAAASQEAATGD